MRASIVIAAHNEGDNLWRTVRSCIATTPGRSCEIVVANDASTDDSIEKLRRRFPRVRIVSTKKRKGCPATKDFGARNSRGDVILFLDGHCKPERGAIARLIADVEELGGNAIFSPKVPWLDAKKWKNKNRGVGECFWLHLLDFSCGWTGTDGMWKRGAFYESPGLVGCCAAVSRKLYKKLRGFDRHMLEWGIEDIDFGLKAWLMGHPVLYDPGAVIGHRFHASFAAFTVKGESVLANKMRMARKNFSDPVWNEWVKRCRSREPKKLWNLAWDLFLRGRKTVESERKYLLKHRLWDEHWYAKRFNLRWPRPAKR